MSDYVAVISRQASTPRIALALNDPKTLLVKLEHDFSTYLTKPETAHLATEISQSATHLTTIITQSEALFPTYFTKPETSLAQSQAPFTVDLAPTEAHENRSFERHP